MTAIEVFPAPEQELVLKTTYLSAHIHLGEITIYIPGADPEESADWLMGFWENLTTYMANHTDPTHLTNWVRKAAYAIDDEHIVRKEFVL